MADSRGQSSSGGASRLSLAFDLTIATDVVYYSKRGYRPLQPHEVDFAEFRCNGVPFAKVSDVPHRPKPPEPPQPQKSPEQAERDAIMAKIRRDREAPKCTATENIRLAPTKR